MPFLGYDGLKLFRIQRIFKPKWRFKPGTRVLRHPDKKHRDAQNAKDGGSS